MVTTSLSAQSPDFLQRSEIVLSGGGMSYIGDLNNQSAFGRVAGAGGVGLHSRINNRWSVRGGIGRGSVSSDDYIEARNLSFRSHIYEFSAVTEFDFQPFGPGATESIWTPYIFGGLAVFHFNPEASYTDAEGNIQWVALQPLHTEGQSTSAHPDRKPYQLIQLAMPFGIGARVRLGKNFSLTAEYGFRITWTDYLDDVSKTYVDASVLQAEVNDGDIAAMMADRSGEVTAGAVNAPGIKRGDDSLNDWYSFFNISLGVNLNMLLGWMRSKRCKL